MRSSADLPTDRTDPTDPIEPVSYAEQKALFLTLQGLPAAAREARLAEVAPPLARAVRAQLIAAEQPVALLDGVVAERRPQLPNYRMLRELGRGGMGCVWLAERQLGDVRQTVALKQILHLHWDDEARRRFERERRILAQLDHPNIAALLDAGVDTQGVPYLATQYVDGQRLDQWCHTRQPSLVERIALLRQIAAAVAYAHGRLVVHRDLKPANILVDAGGQARLLDFGIARALDEDTLTGEGPSLMTLRYAAPEQIDGRGGAGVGIDIHALGVLMYELLTGATPHADRDGAAALSLAILHEPPPPPSRQPGAVGRDRDLDAICAKALRKRPQDRYASAADLQADLERWLAREPVEARRGERGYRLRSFVGRHRWALVGLLLVAATSGSALGYHLHRLDRQLAETQRERDKARATVHWFEALFDAASPNATRSGELSARDLLRLSVERLDQGDTAGLDDDARAGLYYAAGKVLQAQSMLDEAARMHERAIGLWQGLSRVPEADLAVALADRANVDYRRGRPLDALRWQQQAIAQRRAMGDSGSTDLGHMLQMQSIYQRASGQSAAAYVSLQQAAAILRAQLPDSRVYYANVLANLGTLALYRGAADEGDALLREAEQEMRQLKPERTDRLLQIQRARAAALRELGRHAEAETLFADVIARSRAFNGAGDAEVALALHSQAQLFLLQQRWDKAIGALAAAEAIHVATGGPLHPRALLMQSDRARILIEQGRFAEALHRLDTVLAARGNGAGIEGSALAGERVARAYAACRVASPPTANAVAALADAVEAMRADPPLPHARLRQAEAWLAECSAAARQST